MPLSISKILINGEIKMTSTTYSPSIDQAQLQMFRDNFYALTQQTQSRLVGAGVAMFMSSEGKTHNFARIGRLELDAVDGRNPDKQYEDYSLDNRQFTKTRFTKTITVDEKDDINELIADPRSSILTELNKAKERVMDRVIIEAAVGTVKVGSPDTTPSEISAATDGVITVDATSGFTYEKYLETVQNFINNDFDYKDFQGAVLAISGSENTDLMGEIEFISRDYADGRPVKEGTAKDSMLYYQTLFAGSDSAITVNNPILPEGATTRKCVVMAPEAVAVSMELGDLRVEKNNAKVNSWDITIDYWMGAMRTEGVKVQIVSTTI
jgi:hypothetical protein